MSGPDNAILMINSTFGKEASSNAEGLENKVKASMRAVLINNWSTRDDDLLLRCGVAGTLIDVGKDSKDGEKLVATIEALRKFTSAVAAVQMGIGVDFSTVLPTSAENLLPLMKWYNEVKEELRKEGTIT